MIIPQGSLGETHGAGVFARWSKTEDVQETTPSPVPCRLCDINASLSQYDCSQTRPLRDNNTRSVPHTIIHFSKAQLRILEHQRARDTPHSPIWETVARRRAPLKESSPFIWILPRFQLMADPPDASLRRSVRPREGVRNNNDFLRYTSDFVVPRGPFLAPSFDTILLKPTNHSSVWILTVGYARMSFRASWPASEKNPPCAP